jgi:general secretion pathway protein G
MDPWGNPFELIVPGEINTSFDVISLGEDGEVGGEDVNADITQ